MKKSIAFIGALFMGSIAFAQVSKNDTINKTASRKVTNNDLKNVPAVSETDAGSGGAKGSSKFKGEIQDNKKADYSSQSIKGSVTQKGRSNGATMTEESITQKGREGKVSTTEKQNYTIKMSNADKKVAKDTIQKPAKSSDAYIKITDLKGEK